MSKAVKSEPDESFAISYFSQNPIDTRPPQEKLDSIEEQLKDGNLGKDERFTLLVQKRTLLQLLHGESSAEFVRASLDLGAFYNSVNKADSASRNLGRAAQFAKQTELQDDDEFALAIELADANLNAPAATKLEKAKQVAVADLQLSPYAEYESPNEVASFRRHLCLARIRSFRTRWEEALAFYEKALAGYQAAHPPEEPPAEETPAEEKIPEEANICVEAAQVAERVTGCTKASELYRKAHEIYTEMGYEEDAARIEGKFERAAGEAPEGGEQKEAADAADGNPPAQGEQGDEIGGETATSV
jgi:tetratricopeptide (TPR) repeat protein